jgi:hypothetical protein
MKGQLRLKGTVVQAGRVTQLIREYERAVSGWADCLLKGLYTLAGYWASEAERLHAEIISGVE